MAAKAPTDKEAAAVAFVDGGENHKVTLYLYDLTHGAAKQFSPMLLGKVIEGIWHTGVVVFGKEYFYGGGIQMAPAGQTVAGRPMRVIELGYSQIPRDLFHDFLHEISPRFQPETYSLLRHNCNHFSNEVCTFLLGKGIPEYIVGLPEEVLATPFGQMIEPMISGMETSMKQTGGNAVVPWGSESQFAARHAPGGAAAAITSQPAPAASPLAPAPAVAAAVGPLSAVTTAIDAKSVEKVQETKEDEVVEPVKAKSTHPHGSLKLQVVSVDSKPMLSLDQKQSEFKDMIVAAAKLLPAGVQGLSDSDVTVLNDLTAWLSAPPATPPPEKSYGLFERLLLQWPVKKLFAVVALFRLFVARRAVSTYYVKTAASFALITTLLDKLVVNDDKNGVPASTELMMLCAVSNFFSSPAAGRFVTNHAAVVAAAIGALSKKYSTLRMLGATVLYNISLFLCKDTAPDSLTDSITALTDALHQENDTNSSYRMLLALGHLIYCNQSASEFLAMLEFDPSAFIGSGTNAAKLLPIAQDIAALIKTAATAAATAED